jgi:Bacterial extracellular solute-binding protein
MWLVTTGPSPANTVINQAVTSFEKSHPADTITIDYIENQSYKQKIQLAMGAGNAPTIFWTWGGGPLKQFIDAGDVASYAKATVGAGEVPVIKGATGLFAGQQLSSYDQTIYTSVQQAPSFQYSWDQAVPPQEATPMLAGLAQVFELTMTPQKYAATMDSQPSGA